MGVHERRKCPGDGMLKRPVFPIIPDIPGYRGLELDPLVLAAGKDRPPVRLPTLPRRKIGPHHPDKLANEVVVLLEDDLLCTVPPVFRLVLPLHAREGLHDVIGVLPRDVVEVEVEGVKAAPEVKPPLFVPDERPGRAGLVDGVCREPGVPLRDANLHEDVAGEGSRSHAV